jgi:hydrogenase maturation factor
VLGEIEVNDLILVHGGAAITRIDNAEGAQ